MGRGLFFASLMTLGAFANPVTNFLNAHLPQNPDFVEAQSKWNEAQSQFDLSASVFYPKLSLDWKVNRTETRAEFKDLLTAQATQNLFAGGSEYSNLHAKRMARDLAHNDLKDVADRIIAQGTKLITRLQIQKRRIEVLSQNKRAQEDRIQELRRRVRLGQSREPDLLQALVEDSRLERQKLDALDLQAQLTQEFRSSFNLSDTDFEAFDRSVTPDHIIGHIRVSLVSRQDYKRRSLELKRDISASERRSVWRSSLPQFGLYALQNLRDPNSTANEWEFGLKASWVLFEGFKTNAELRSNAAAQSLADHQLQNYLTSREEKLKLLQQQKNHLQEKRVSVEENLKLAERALSQQRRDYRLGLVTALEVEQTLQSLLSLKLEQLDLYEVSLELQLREFLGGDDTI